MCIVITHSANYVDLQVMFTTNIRTFTKMSGLSISQLTEKNNKMDHKTENI